jgi:nitroreductase
MSSLDSLDARRSVPAKQLGEPGPDDATLLDMLRSAMRTRERDPQASDAAVEKDRNRFAHAPLVMAVVARLGPDEKIPESERFSAAACVCFALLQAAQARGFGAQWLTGWPAYDPVVLRLLGLGEDERVAGFIHIGTAKLEAPERERPDPAMLLSDLRLPLS